MSHFGNIKHLLRLCTVIPTREEISNTRNCRDHTLGTGTLILSSLVWSKIFTTLTVRLNAEIYFSNVG